MQRGKSDVQRYRATRDRHLAYARDSCHLHGLGAPGSRPAPLLGEHTDEILSEELGLSLPRSALCTTGTLLLAR